ncbi:MAG: glycosyltransferase family 39 protein [Elusimicrobiota bacterium]
MAREKSRWLWPCIFLLSLLFFTTESYYGIDNLSSEGLTLVPAVEILNGGVPFRDYASYSPPGMHYVAAGVFKVFGRNLFLARFLTTALAKWLIVLALFGCARLMRAPRAAAAAGVIFATVILGTKTFAGADYAGVHPTALSTALVLLSIYCFLQYIETGRRNWLAGASLITVLNVPLRYDFAAYTFLAQLLIAGLAAHTGYRKRRLLPIVKEAAVCYLACSLLVLLPLAAYLWIKVPRAELALSLLEYPQAYLKFVTANEADSVWRRIIPNPFPTIGALFAGQVTPWGYIRHWLLYDNLRTFIFASYIWGWIWLAGRTRREGAWDQLEFGTAALVLLGTCLWGYFIKSWNLFTFPVPAYLLAPLMIARFWQSNITAWRRTARVMAVWALGLSAVALAVKPIVPRAYHRWSHIPAARGTIFEKREARNLEDLVRYIQNIVPAGGKIFVCNMRHDGGHPDTDLLLYLFTDRRPGTHIHDLWPHISTREDIQQRIIGELKRNDVRCVIRSDSHPPFDGAYHGSRTLDDYLDRAYRKTVVFGAHTVLERI